MTETPKGKLAVEEDKKLGPPYVYPQNREPTTLVNQTDPNQLNNWTITFNKPKKETTPIDNTGTATEVTETATDTTESVAVPTDRILINSQEVQTGHHFDNLDDLEQRYNDRELLDLEGRPAEEFAKKVTVFEQGNPVTYGEVDGVFYKTAAPLIEPIVKGAEWLYKLRPDLQKGAVKGALIEGPTNLNNAVADLFSLPGRYGTKVAADITNRLFGTKLKGTQENYFKTGMNDFLNWVGEYIPYNSDVKDWRQEKTEYPAVQEAVTLISQFGINAVPAATIVKGLTSANAIARGYMWAAWADAVSFDNDHTTAVQDFGILKYLETAPEGEKNAFFSTVGYIGNFYFENNPDEAEANRFRLALEGALIGKGVDALFPFIPKFIKFMPWKKAFAALAVAAAAAPEEAEGAISVISKILKRPTVTTGKLTSADVSVVKNASGGNRVKEQLARQVIRKLRADYPPSQGWDKFEVTGGTFKTEKGELKFTPKFKQPAYAFHNPKGRIKRETHFKNMSNRVVSTIENLARRAAAGEKEALDIVAQARWYRDTSQRLRKEFGGLGDLFADLLGATSAQTNVRQNVDNAILVLQRFSRGDFDKEIKAYSDRIKAGEKMGSKDLHKLFKDGKFPLITKVTGELFNANSPAATEALLGIFRDVKVNKAPKTLNFTKNVLGVDHEATIDVWAARYLRDLAGLPRIIPKAEKAVSGKHLTGSTFEKSRVGGEFAFGQQVFADAAKKINESGVIKNIDPTIGDLKPDDLQAVAWFLEKEKWAKLGYPDIGGSATDELAVAGVANQARVKELRAIINKAEFTAAEKAAARAELEKIQKPLQRTVLGVSPEREGAVPTNVTMAKVASELDNPLRKQDSIVGYQLTPSYGRFKMEDAKGKTIDVSERSLNAEIVAREDFNPTPVMDALVKVAKKYDQDSVFMAKVVNKSTPGAKPGTEVFFKRRMPRSFAEELVTVLRDLDVDGFQLITDNRLNDTARSMAEVKPKATKGTAGITGIRWLYVPDYDPKWPDKGTAKQQAEYLKEVRQKYYEILHQISVKYPDVITTGNVLHFKVTTKNKPDGGWK